MPVLQIGGATPAQADIDGIRSALELDLARKPVGVTSFGATTVINADIMGATNILATSNFTLAITGNPVDFQIVQARITAVGGNILATLGFRIPSSSTVTSPITVVSGTKTVVTLQWDAASAYWGVVTVVAGYPLS